jgi:hypothetical protein
LHDTTALLATDEFLRLVSPDVLVRGPRTCGEPNISVLGVRARTP